jgi:hypothetical protein
MAGRQRAVADELSRCLMGASRLGINPAEYIEQVDAGNRWCTWHKAWEWGERFPFLPATATRRARRSPLCREGHTEQTAARRTNALKQGDETHV